MKDLIYIDEYGLLGSNFYWDKRDKAALTENALRAVGLTDNRVQVHKDIADLLVRIDGVFQSAGYRMYVKEGYRSEELYGLVYKKRVEMFGKEATDKLLNMEDMPHATGKAVDIALYDLEGKQEVFMRNKSDGDNAYFVDFYNERTDEEGKRYHELQTFLINTMLDHGFKLGTKREYFHFNHDPKP